MPGSYTADEQSAAKMMAAIADNPDELIVGVGASTGTATTDVIVTHGLSGAPDFVMGQRDKTDAIGLSWSANTTSVTFVGTSVTTWTVCYIIGYTA